MTRLAGMLDRIGGGLILVAACAAVLLTLFVCLSAAMRYLFGSPFHFTEELVALLFLAMVFLTLPAATSRRQHIRVTLVTARLRGSWRSVANAFNVAVILAFSTWFGIEAFRFADFAVEIGAITEQSGIILWPWMAVLPASAGLAALISLLQLAQAVTGRDPGGAVSDGAGPGDPE
ncbi:MAG: TRAP transporter small permease [Sneathiellaceae bacterium]